MLACKCRKPFIVSGIIPTGKYKTEFYVCKEDSDCVSITDYTVSDLNQSISLNCRNVDAALLFLLQDTAITWHKITQQWEAKTVKSRLLPFSWRLKRPFAALYGLLTFSSSSPEPLWNLFWRRLFDFNRSLVWIADLNDKRTLRP